MSCSNLFAENRELLVYSAFTNATVTGDPVGIYKTRVMGLIVIRNLSWTYSFFHHEWPPLWPVLREPPCWCQT